MKTIIAPTDFSGISLNAVNYAVAMACSIEADLTLLHVCLLPLTYSEASDIISLTTDAREKILRLRDDLIKTTNNKIKINTEFRTDITAVAAINDFCQSQKPYAVVMGAQGGTTLERGFFGSNTVGAMRHLQCPLIVVPSDAKFSSLKKIGLACDLKKVDESVPFAEIRKLMKDLNPKLYVLHVNSDQQERYPATAITELRSVQNGLDDLHASYHFLTDNDIEKGLEKFADDNKLDLLIVVPKKHNIIDRIFHRSHSKKLALHSRVPVMAIHEY